MDKQNNGAIVRIPVQFTFKGKGYTAEVIGKAAPFNKYFTCRIPGANILILKAVPGAAPNQYSWTICHGNEFSYLAPFLGKEIEKYFA
jgi:hypothetical protein